MKTFFKNRKEAFIKNNKEAFFKHRKEALSKSYSCYKQEMKSLKRNDLVEVLLEKMDEIEEKNNILLSLLEEHKTIVDECISHEAAIIEQETDLEALRLNGFKTSGDKASNAILEKKRIQDDIKFIKNELAPIKARKEELDKEVYSLKAKLSEEVAVIEKFAQKEEIQNAIVSKVGYADNMENGIATHFKPFSQAAKDFQKDLLKLKEHLEKPNVEPDDRLNIKVYEESSILEAVIEIKELFSVPRQFVVSINSEAPSVEIGVLEPDTDGSLRPLLIGKGSNFESIVWIDKKYDDSHITKLHERLITCRRLAANREKGFERIRKLKAIMLGEISLFDEKINKEVY